MTSQDVRRAVEGLRNVDGASDTQTTYAQLPVEAQSLIDVNRQAWDGMDVNDFRAEVENKIQSTAVFDVILPTYPHDSFLHDIVSWFRREVHANSLLNISVRRSLGGGMVLRSKNRLFDMSLRPKIVQHKNKIPEVLRRV